MATATRQIKQLGLEGVSGNHMVGTRVISNPISGHTRGRKTLRALPIGDHWKLTTDGDLNITVWRRAGKGWEANGHYLRLETALCGLVDAEVRKSDLADLQGVVAVITELKRDILKLAAA